ncbi:MAG: hypothetical protein E6Q97_33085 [Desulfurellales bacterium]|nr:MAG: hypothetical protein E6Q97_33085 [Desulfurellales bacterium]
MANENLQKHTLLLRKGDFDFLEGAFHARGVPPSIVIRKLVSKLVDSLQQNASAEELSKIKGDLE